MEPSFGKMLKGFREAKNLTREQLASKLGVNAMDISEWEHGISMPEISLLSDIAKTYKISINRLLKYY